MNPNWRKNIDYYKNPAGYHFTKYTTWYHFDQVPSDDLAEALSRGWAPEAKLMAAVAKFQAEPYDCFQKSNLRSIVQKINEENRRNKPIGSLDSLPIAFWDADKNCLSERLGCRPAKPSGAGYVISFERTLHTEAHMTVGVWEVFVQVLNTKIGVVVPARDPETSLGMPALSIDSSKMTCPTSTSFDYANIKEELESIWSKESEVESFLQQICSRRKELLEELLNLRPGSSSNESGSVAGGSLSDWTKL
ncbi:hypothetical protein HD553DRAFT_325794 [Filobasidium floriforme]|uniref:uncharacterized protein n=1 Tax=Filobasidium floriforme TaxID=5210 RepID=UPI001E8D4B82|nr:uncharacterized protein HD553DRAFT_325794 [Filobasidium floriforme]KAH8080822.1 hypothetical protein HD553DRAFT_325794 [Filobasidium floriforme]